MAPSRQAQNHNARGMSLSDEGRFDEAAEAYLQAIAAAPQWDTPMYNLGLVYKRQKKWAQSLDYNRRATALDPANEAAWWNLGIASTAVGDWKVAREAWRGFGIPGIPAGDGPIDFPCGVGPVRLNPDGDGEVVWAQRLDPARMLLLSVPLPESGFCWGDIVLNDGQPVGYRQHRGQEVPVFNALQLLETSESSTFVARVQMPPDQALVERLAKIAMERGGAAEDWSTSLNMICKACSEGRPHAEHDHEKELPESAHLIGLAARDREHASAILREWEGGLEAIQVESLEDALVRPGTQSE